MVGRNLPQGYYFVGTKNVNGSEECCVSFAGKEYIAKAGINYFSTLCDAMAAVEIVPKIVVEGLEDRYASFSAPVILVGSGVYDHKVLEVTKDVYIIGDEDTKLVGQFWFGFFFVRSENFTIDNFTFENIRIEDHRDEAKEYFLTCRNLTYVGQNPWWSFYAPTKGKESVKKYLFENITLNGVDGFGYGFEFFRVSPTELTIRNLKAINTNKSLLFCDVQPCAIEGGENTLLLENCEFQNNQWEQEININFSKCGGQVRVESCKFENNLKNCDLLFRLELSDDAKFIVTNSAFIENNKRFAVSNASNNQVRLQNCELKTMLTKQGSYVFSEQEEKEFLLRGMSEVFDGHEQVIDDFAVLENLYANRKPFYCDMHAHSNSGGTSDGLLTFAEWKEEMQEKKLDFVSIADHRQMRHFFLPDFDDAKFFYANEPEAILEGNYACPRLHYNMIFPDKYCLGKMLEHFKEKYEFQGDELTGSFIYKTFTHEELETVANFVTENGGIFAHAHPKTMLTSDNPLDYYFGEKTYIECFSNEYMAFSAQKNCKLWIDLLALGKRVYNLSGSDSHGHCKNGCVNVVYAEKKHNSSLFPYFKSGDFSSGAMGIKMSLGQTPMGGVASWREGDKLLIEVGDLFEIYQDKTFLVKVVTDQGVAYSCKCDGKEKLRLALSAQKRKFYRVEIIDLDNFCIFALSNPIWID